MKKGIKPAVFLVVFLFLFSSGLFASRVTLRKADQAYARLLRSKRRFYRDSWLRVARMYKSLLKRYPQKRAYIYRKLYLVYSGLYRYSGRSSDRKKAYYYRLLSRRRSRGSFAFSERCVSFNVSSGYLRVSLPGWVKFRKFYLERPLRLVVDVYPARFRKGFSRFTRGPWCVKCSQFKRGVVRLVMRVRGKVRVERVAGDIVVFSEVPEPRYALSLSGVRTVVIDPGHGGKDPGAIGSTGLREKDVVLGIALRLERMLKRRTDLRVFLTRRKDVYIPLERRVLFARRVGADLFISIHVNASRNRRLSGLEVYYADPYRCYAKVRGRRGVDFILADLVSTSRLRSSRDLSLEIRRYLLRDVGFRDNGVRKAPFFVLMNTPIPSVLVEAGYITNPREERRMRTKRYRYLVAKGIFDGLVHYLRRRTMVMEARL